MNKQQIIAAAAGAVVLFIWSLLSWMVLPFHSQTLNPVPETAIEVQTMKDQMPDAGVYHYPGLPGGTAANSWENLSRRMREEPVITLMVFLPDGTDLLPVENFIFGLILNLAAAGLAVFLLGLTPIRNYWNKVVFVGLLGTFAVLSASLPEYLWFGYPADFVVAAVFDVIVGWSLAGAAIAWITRKS